MLCTVIHFHTLNQIGIVLNRAKIPFYNRVKKLPKPESNRPIYTYKINQLTLLSSAERLKKSTLAIRPQIHSTSRHNEKYIDRQNNGVVSTS